MSKCENATDDMSKYLCPICEYPLSDIFTDPKNKLTIKIPIPVEVKICNKCGNVQMFACDYLKKRKDTGMTAPKTDLGTKSLS